MNYINFFNGIYLYFLAIGGKYKEVIIGKLMEILLDRSNCKIFM